MKGKDNSEAVRRVTLNNLLVLIHVSLLGSSECFHMQLKVSICENICLGFYNSHLNTISSRNIRRRRSTVPIMINSRPRCEIYLTILHTISKLAEQILPMGCWIQTKFQLLSFR